MRPVQLCGGLWTFFLYLVCPLLEKKRFPAQKSLGELKHLGRYLLYRHAEWIETRDLTRENTP